MPHRSLLAIVLVALAFMVTGCATSTNVYPAPVFTEHPKIERIAVAPFILPASVATEKTKRFEVKSYQEADGTTIYYSVDFAAEYARGLAMFPGVQVVFPADVERRWMASMKTPKERNPMANPAAAREIGASLTCDAIIVGSVKTWDMFKPDLNLEWRLLATNHRGSGNSVIDTEREGTGGQSYKDYSKVPVFHAAAALNAETHGTQALLADFGRSVDVERGYASAVDYIRHQPWPRYLHFAAWATMSEAYRAHQPEE